MKIFCSIPTMCSIINYTLDKEHLRTYRHELKYARIHAKNTCKKIINSCAQTFFHAPKQTIKQTNKLHFLSEYLAHEIVEFVLKCLKRNRRSKFRMRANPFIIELKLLLLKRGGYARQSEQRLLRKRENKHPPNTGNDLPNP